MTDGLLPQQSSTTTTVAPTTDNLNNNTEDVGVSDLLFLEPLTEQSLIDNLRRRFHADKIYTSMGSLMLSINPYRPLPLYDEQTLRSYRFRRVTDLPPHIFGIATAAYRELTSYGTNQVVILSGECGSGKTEVANLIIQTITSVAGQVRSSVGAESDPVNDKLNTFSQILGAFGNARTEKNDNASRFGKYVEIGFDSHGGTVGAIVTTYQLDKSRVVFQGPRERNFHIFYQLLAGADVHLLKSLKLQRNVEKYSLLRFSGVYKIEGLDEKREFVICKEALEILGFSAAECQSVFQILAAVLKLGNLQFLPKTNVDGTESSTMLNDHEVTEVSELLECPHPKRFLNVLTKVFTETKGEILENAISAQEASSLRDQLCRALYNRLFTWIVSKINSGLAYDSSSCGAVMGVVDLYGFESFERNDFEQFLINFTAEKLHHLVTDLIMKYEQEEYVKEGLSWTHVPYVTNNEVCELIEKNHYGIFAILEEINQRDEPVSPEHVLHRLAKHHVNNKSFFPPEERATNNVPMDQFKIRHFAGTVAYQMQNFLEKNTDSVSRELAELMYSCRQELVQELFPDGNKARQKSKKTPTLSSHLRTALTSLLNSISNKTPTLIKCIKPNDQKRPHFFDEERVRHQIRYTNLLDQIKVRRAGYAFRQPYDRFLRRYKMLSGITWPIWEGDVREGVKILLLSLELKPIEFAFGKSRIFIKFAETMSRLEDLRKQRMEEIAVMIQKTFRGHRVRQKLKLSTSTSIPSSLQSVKDSTRKLERLPKLLMRSLYNDQHSSVSSSMDSSHSVPYTPCNSYYPITGVTFTAGQTPTPPPSSVTAETAPRPPAAQSATPPVPAPPPVAPKPVMAAKPKPVHSQSSNDILAAASQVKIKPQPPIRRTATVGNCISNMAMDSNEAARRITVFLRSYARYKFLMYLLRHLPSMSPVDHRWPSCPSFLLHTNLILKNIYHRWRCRKFRLRYDQTSISRMREKVAASSIFYGKKTSYPRTVPHPFRGDYVRLRQNVKWRKLAADTNDQYVVFADIMPKINRTSGRPSYVLVVISTKSFLVIDQRTMIVKYRIQAADISRISVSPYQDDIVVIHLKPGELFKRKGDFMFQSGHVIEMVTKLCLVVQNCTGKQPEVTISPEFPVQFSKEMVLVHFKSEENTPNFTPEVTPPSSVKVTRRTNRMEVSLSQEKSKEDLK